MNEFKFELGVEAKDLVTGFQGIIVARTQYLTGCNRYGIQSQKLGKDGKPGDWQHFDEMMLVQTGKGLKESASAQLLPGGKKPGGPPRVEASEMRRKD